MTTLSGPLADDLWRIGHEDAAGRLWVDAVGMSLGLAAGLLGELWLGGHVRIGQGRLEVALGQPLPADELAGSVVRLLAREATDFTLPSWLAFLGRDSYERVTRRMAAAGHIQRQRRHLTGSAWLATDTARALRPPLHLRHKLASGYPLVCSELALAGLVSACGLQEALLVGAPDPAVLRERLGEWLRWPDMHPALTDLLSYTRAAAGRAAMTART
jgi:Golgi phosphoprotein 3 (GPP34)